MAKTKHTPGPYEAKIYPGDDIYTIGKACAGGTLCPIAEAPYYGDDDATAEELKANAVLLAGAPKLLEALTHLLSYANEYSDFMAKDCGRGANELGEKADSVSVAGIAKAAIDKATT